jgi:hypothetical protein
MDPWATDEAMNKKRGRPTIKAGEPSAAINLKLPVSQWDEVDRRARREGISSAEVVRRLIKTTENCPPGKGVAESGR